MHVMTLAFPPRSGKATARHTGGTVYGFLRLDAHALGTWAILRLLRPRLSIVTGGPRGNQAFRSEACPPLDTGLEQDAEDMEWTVGMPGLQRPARFLAQLRINPRSGSIFSGSKSLGRVRMSLCLA